MAGQTRSQNSFNMGEVSPRFFHETESDLYWKSAQKLFNIFVTNSGSASRRPGSKFYASVNALPNFPGTFVYSRFQTVSITAQERLYYAILLQLDNHLWVNIGTDFFYVDLSSLPWVNPPTPDYSTIRYASIGNYIVLLAPWLRTSTLSYNPTTPAIHLDGIFNFLNPPTFDFGQIPYTNLLVVNVTGTFPNFIIKFEFSSLTPTFTTDWIGGLIIGPGPDTTAPLASGRIRNVTITTGTGGTDVTFDVLASLFAFQTGFLNSSQFVVQQPIFSDTLGYPSMAIQFENRLFMSGFPAIPLGIFGSTLGTINNFDVGLGNPTDGISWVSSQEDIGTFQSLNVGKHLQVYALNGELSVPDTSFSTSPSAFTLKRQSSFGIMPNCQAINFQNDTFFAGRSGKTIFRMVQTGGLESTYETASISDFASHLIKNPIKLTTFYGWDGASLTVAVLNKDNTVAIFQYNSLMQLSAWSEFQLGEGAQVLGIDALNYQMYLFIYQPNGDQYYIVTLDLSIQNLFVDNGSPISISAGQTSVEIPAIYINTTIAISDGTTFLGDYLVPESGVIELIAPPTEDFIGWVGWDYDTLLIPLPLCQMPELKYNYNRINRIYVDYVNSLGIVINGELISYQDFLTIQQNESLELQTGTFEHFPEEGWQKFNQLEIAQIGPLAMEITSLGYELNIGGL